MEPANDDAHAVYILFDRADWHIANELHESLIRSAIRTSAKGLEPFWRRGAKLTVANILNATAAVIVVSEVLAERINEHRCFIDVIVDKYCGDSEKRKRVVLLMLDEETELNIEALQNCKTVLYDPNDQAHLDEIYYYLKSTGVRPADKDTETTSGFFQWHPVGEPHELADGILFRDGECDLHYKQRALDILIYHQVMGLHAIDHFNYYYEPRRVLAVFDTGKTLDLGLQVPERSNLVWSLAREVHIVRTSNNLAVEGYTRKLYKVGKPSIKLNLAIELFATLTNTSK